MIGLPGSDIVLFNCEKRCSVWLFSNFSVLEKGVVVRIEGSSEKVKV
jgi:hypothetical protein